MSNPPGRKKPPSLQTVARSAGVSIATVSRVVNGQDASFSAETIARVNAVIEEVGYRPQHFGRSLRTRQSSIIGALSSDPSNAYFAAIAQSIQEEGRRRDCVLLMADTMGDPVRQDDYLAEMQSYMARGIVMFGAVPTPTLQRMLEQRVPIVFIIRPSSLSIPAALVGVDNLRVGEDVAEHFLAQGILPAGVLSGASGSAASDARVAGFTRRFAAVGQSVFTLPPLTSDSRGRMQQTESGYLQAKALLERHPGLRGLFCVTDLMAYGAYRRCCELGLKVPEDIVIFGVDDNPLNQWVAPWLSTVRTPYQDFGSAVWNVFERLWDGSETAPQVTLPHELIIRPDKGPPQFSSRHGVT